MITYSWSWNAPNKKIISILDHFPKDVRALRVPSGQFFSLNWHYIYFFKIWFTLLWMKYLNTLSCFTSLLLTSPRRVFSILPLAILANSGSSWTSSSAVMMGVLMFLDAFMISLILGTPRVMSGSGQGLQHHHNHTYLLFKYYPFMPRSSLEECYL